MTAHSRDVSSQRLYRVRQIAELASVSVRTLHYYDELGLLVPSDRSRAGHRLYSERDLLRLQQIVIHRELGFPLEDIKQVLDAPSFNYRRALVEQRRQLEQRVLSTEKMLRAVDLALAALEAEEPKAATTTDDLEQLRDGAQRKDRKQLKDQEQLNMKNLFDGFDPSQYEHEAKQRWGDTDAYKVSKERTQRYGAADWQALKEEQASIYRDAAQAQRAGRQSDGAEAIAIAERHRRWIERWFYPCSVSAHAALADMYEAEPRFAANIDVYGEGLTPFLAAAIRANRQGHD